MNTNTCDYICPQNKTASSSLLLSNSTNIDSLLSEEHEF